MMLGLWKKLKVAALKNWCSLYLEKNLNVAHSSDYFYDIFENLSQVETLDIIGDPLITLSLNKLLERACLFKIQRGGFVSLCLWGTSALCVQLNSNGTWPQLLPNFMHFLSLIFIQFQIIISYWYPSILNSYSGGVRYCLRWSLYEDNLVVISNIPTFFLNFWPILTMNKLV